MYYKIKIKAMKKTITYLMFIACLIMTACSNDDEPIVIHSVVGTWNVQYPAGLQTEGFTEWSFNTSGELSIRTYDVFAGDHTSTYDYSISEENKSLTISGDIKNAEGETIHDKFAIYEIVKLTKKALRIKQTWLNTGFDDLSPEDKNVFLLGGHKEESFRR